MGNTTTCGSAGLPGWKLAASSASRNQALNAASDQRRPALPGWGASAASATRAASSCAAPSCKRSTSITRCPAASWLPAAHQPSLRRASARSVNHCGSGRGACRLANRSATPGGTNPVVAGWVSTAAQAARPWTRAWRSTAVAALACGPDLSQSSTSSVRARRSAARSKLISRAAAWVVESFQPVSSRTERPAPCSNAPMRRVSARSCATSATGVRPWFT